MPLWQHIKYTKKGDLYTILGHGLIEGTMTPCVVYRLAGPLEGPIWVRPSAEFFDGRFLMVLQPGETGYVESHQPGGSNDPAR